MDRNQGRRLSAEEGSIILSPSICPRPTEAIQSVLQWYYVILCCHLEIH